MTRQHARQHSKTTVQHKRAVRSHKASANRRRKMPLEVKSQNSPDTVLPNAIEFLEIDIVGPFDAGLEAEESELVAAEIEGLR